MVSHVMVCEDRDFQIALAMSRKLVQHAARVFSELPEEEQLPKRKNLKERFFEQLPEAFNRQQYLVLKEAFRKSLWCPIGTKSIGIGKVQSLHQ